MGILIFDCDFESPSEGVIPTEFGMLQKIEKLDLQNNNLYGEIPFQLGDLPLSKYCGYFVYCPT